MTKKALRRLAARLLFLSLAAVMPAAALAWSDATHVYLAKHTEKATGQMSPTDRCNRFYGAVAVDMFAYDFTVEGQTLHAILHDRSMAVPALPYALASSPAERALGFGLANHNNAWGTDATAHFDGITEGNREGYVIAKAKALAAVPWFNAAVSPLVGGNEETLLLVSHILVEYAIDLAVVRNDPSVGAELFTAGYACAGPGSDLLVKAWVPVFSNWIPPGVAEGKIRGADAAYHQWVAAYGMALQQPNAQELVGGAVAKLAIEFLRLPPEALPQVAQLVDGALTTGQALVGSDLQGELDATIGRVNGQMSVLKITP